MPPTDEGRPAHANVLGVAINAVNMQRAVRRARQILDERRKGYICLTGVHGIMEAQRDSSLRRILNRAVLCLPDGVPTVWVGRCQGYREMRRVYGPDFMLEMCCSAPHRHDRHFLLGGKPGVANQLQQRLERRAPGIEIVGTFTPPFRELMAEEEDALIALIAETRPDIVWVGLSTPKQERFMARFLERFDTCLMVGVGAAFDIHAGLLADAPQWMKRSGLQWLYRLLQEPRRLARRYFSNNPRFVWEIGRQLAGLRKFEVSESEE